MINSETVASTPVSLIETMNFESAVHRRQIEEIERIAKCALAYLNGQPFPDTEGKELGFIEAPEFSGVKGM